MKYTAKIVQFPDSLDSYKAAQFKLEIENLLKSGVKTVLLDLKHVTFMSSSGLMALISTLRVVKSADCQLLIYSWNEQVKMLLEITGLDQVFEMFTALE